MSDNKYNFYAYVHTPKIVQSINIETIGIWDQVSEDKLYPAGTLSKLEDVFKAMVRKGKSPFNFRWSPFVDKAKKVNQATLFRSLSERDRSTIELRIQLTDSGGNRHTTLFWNFYDVGVIRTRPFRKSEIVEAHYSKFDTGSNQP